MTTEKDPQLVRLDDVRLDYPVFFDPKQYKGKGDQYYSGTFIIAKTSPQLATLAAAIKAAAEAKWPGKSAEKLAEFKAKDKLPVHDGDLRAAKGQKDYEGMLYLSARNNATKKPPVPVFDKHNDPSTNLPRQIKSEADSRAPFAGCYVNVTVRVFGYENEGSGIGCEILGVQRARPHGTPEGERILRQRLSTAADYAGVPPLPVSPVSTTQPGAAPAGQDSTPNVAPAASMFL
jgi:hypothetical protein